LHNTTRPLRAAVLAVACHAAAPAIWPAFLVLVVPRFAAVLSDLSGGAYELPLATTWVLNMSSVVVARWYIYALVLTPFLATDAAIWIRLITSGRQAIAAVWSRSVLVVEIVITLILVVATYGPLTRIAQFD